MTKFQIFLRRVRYVPGTHILLALNIVVFIVMIFIGVSPVAPSTYALLMFGATQPDLVASGEVWRLLTAAFVHVGFIHLFFNMWCLWNLGLLGEPLLGPLGIAGIYFITAIAGNILSTLVNLRGGHDIVGAGASGAVFGIAGALIILLSNKKLPIPWDELKRIRGKVIQFALLNLAIGATTYFLDTAIRIDNMAHLGGVLSGLALGFALMPAMTWGRRLYIRRQLLTFGVATLVMLGGVFYFW